MNGTRDCGEWGRGRRGTATARSGSFPLGVGGELDHNNRKEPKMAELTNIESKLAEVLGLAQAAQLSTQKVMKLVDDDDVRSTLQRMHEEAAEAERRCSELAEQLEGKKTAIQEKARETKSEASKMMSTYLGDDADSLDGLEFLLMAEAGELGHVEIVGELNEQTGDERVRELVEWALPIQQRHFEDTRSAALAIARHEDATATAA